MITNVSARLDGSGAFTILEVEYDGPTPNPEMIGRELGGRWLPSDDGTQKLIGKFASPQMAKMVAGQMNPQSAVRAPDLPHWAL